jgi:hypothetical protein
VVGSRRFQVAPPSAEASQLQLKDISTASRSLSAPLMSAAFVSFLVNVSDGRYSWKITGFGLPPGSGSPARAVCEAGLGSRSSTGSGVGATSRRDRGS